MPTMNDIYGDGSAHEACPGCGMCLTCGDCLCGYSWVLDNEGACAEKPTESDE
jgi:hypothetical protein